MDYGKVLSRAWEITWRWKVLWILGFLASLGSGTASTGNPTYSTDSSNWTYGPWGPRFQMPPEVIGIIIAVACLGVLIAIALWVISVMARGGLIAGVDQVEEEGSTSFLRAWRVGRDRFWTLFGISILTALPIFVLVVLGIVVMGLLIAGTVGAIDRAAEIGGALGGISLFVCGGVFCCGTIIISLVLGQIRIYAERAAILERLGWTDAFGRGWQVLKENLGPTIVFWLIFLVISMVIGFVVFAGVAAIALPFMATWSRTNPGPWVWAPICLGGIVGALVIALVNSIVQTFTSSTWTLVYRALTGMGAPTAEVVEAVE